MQGAIWKIGSKNNGLLKLEEVFKKIDKKKRKRYDKIRKKTVAEERSREMEQQKRKKNGRWHLVWWRLVLIFWNLMQNTADQQKLRVVCVGDELTEPMWKHREDNCYPVQLQKYMERQRKKYRSKCGSAAVQKRAKAIGQKKNDMRAVPNIKRILVCEA